MKRVLGLDASSTTIGIAIIDYDDSQISLHDCFYYKPPKKGNIFERLSKVRNYIQELIDTYNPDDVSLEDIVLHMKGHSTAKTITTLAVLNRTVGTAVFDKHGKAPYLYNVMRIRHAIKTSKKLPAKEDIPELVAHHLGPSFVFLTDKKGKVIKKKNGDYKEENYDIADGIACALCHIFKDREGVADQLQVKKKKTRKKKKT